MPPSDPLYASVEDHLGKLRRKLDMYAGLGLEPLVSQRPEQADFDKNWLRAREDVIQDVLLGHSLLMDQDEDHFIEDRRKKNADLAERIAHKVDELKDASKTTII